MDIQKEGGNANLPFSARSMTHCDQLYRQRGKEGVPRDSKYTGRKRRVVF
jgi:hypothetical protein